MFKKVIQLIVYLSFVTSVNAENIRIYDVVVPFSAGGASDILFRAIEPELNNQLQSYQIKLVIKNISGAAGSIGLSKIMNSNELTFGFFSPFFAINKPIRAENNYNYDSVNFLSFAGYNKMVIISGAHPTLLALQDNCSKNKTITFGSSGVGSTSHLSAYYFATKYLNCKEVISVPYRGVSMVYQDLKAGRINFMADFTISVDNFIESKYFNRIEEIKEGDLTAWHIFVSNKIENKDAIIIKTAFDSLKTNKQFVKTLENKFHISQFSESKDINWLKLQFDAYKSVIETLPKVPNN